MKVKHLLLALFVSILSISSGLIEGYGQAEAATQTTTVKDLQKLLKGWTLAGVNSETYKSRTSVTFEKLEPIKKKWAVNELNIYMWKENQASFENDVKAFIQELKKYSTSYKIKKHTSTVFEASNFDGLEYVYDYVIKTKTGYTVYEIKLKKENEGWRYSGFGSETPTKTRINEIDKLAPKLVKAFMDYKFVDTQKKETVMKSISLQKEWKLVETRITGDAHTEFVPKGWSRHFEKKAKYGVYELEINKTVITKERHETLLKRFKKISTLTNSSKAVKAYRTEIPISIINDQPGGRSGDNRIVFIQKKGSKIVEYYYLYFDAPKPDDVSSYFVEQWNGADKKEANKSFDFVINTLIKANS